MPEPVTAQRKGRIVAIDIARGVALVAMAIYHFTWDLEFFGYLEAGTTAIGGWKLFARSIASSFLFLVGVSLWLAHRHGIRWTSFLTRLAMVAGAAAAISLVTWLALPGGFIFFGILHQIALASLLGLLFLRLPAALIAVLAIAVIALPHYARHPVFDHAALWWVGLSEAVPRSNDYVPLFPWFGAVLLGMAAAKLAATTGMLDRMRSAGSSGLGRLLELGGRHSLAVYLIHQPVLMGLVYLATLVIAPPVQDPVVGFRAACQAQCTAVRGESFCKAYCGCVIELVQTEDGGLARLDSAADDPDLQTRMQEIALYCTSESDLELFESPSNEP